jgi:release factor glutamine methyltransferase
MKTPLLSDITNCFASTSDTPALDASVLIAHVVNKPRTWVMAHPELTLTTEQQKQLDDALAELERGKPFPYILGNWEFFGLNFNVTPDVLIPRPETELLVEKAIAWLQKSPAKRTVADIGTGSGAIAVSIAVNIPSAHILATDISPKALQIAKQNAINHGVNNKIEFIECDLLPNQSQIVNRKSPIVNRKSSFNLLCANLPYIPTETLHNLLIYGREPTLALDGGIDGLDLFHKLMKLAPEWMVPNSLMLLEIEATLGEQAIQLAHDLLPNTNIQLHKDLTGRDRLLEIELP